MIDWKLPTIIDYWDAQKDAVPAMSERLRQVAPENRKEALQRISEAVVEHALALTPLHLTQVAISMIDDLYKAMNRPQKFDDVTLTYLRATAGVFSRVISHRRSSVRYVVDNSFELTPDGLIDVLRGFPLWFNASGFVYICPQAIGQKLLASEDPAQLIAALKTLRPEAVHVCDQLIAEAQKERRHYVFLDAEDDAGSVQRALGGDDPRAIRILRQEAPLPGTKVAVFGGFPASN